MADLSAVADRLRGALSDIQKAGRSQNFRKWGCTVFPSPHFPRYPCGAAD